MNPFWIAFGDIHDDLTLLPRIPDLDQAGCVIVTGDLTVGQGADRAHAILETIRRHNPNVLAQLGNMDRADTTAYLESHGQNLHLRAHTLLDGPDSVGIVGVGTSTPTPFGTPSEFPEAQISAWLDEAWNRKQDWKHTILACHTPPYDTTTDRIGNGAHVGSPGVRAFIERTQPDLCLTGHIHESRAIDHIGKTTILNPGNFGAGGYIHITLTPSGLHAELRQA
ncbi:MAG: metallophosphoesterase family protein [Desulfovibrionaceae bacterium]|jgi:Icc-related predicted phosphoesterase|nr:metallophosphoesterase family protein [Desulfovibrionaceae bacterium]